MQLSIETKGIMTTPKKETKEIRKFANQIVKKPVIKKLIINPDEYSEKSECFQNVENYIKKNNGNIQYGWIIWESPNIMLEAEFHAVYKSIDNELIDITPSNHGESEILFLCDNAKTYNGERINNQRYPLLNNKIVLRFIENSKKFDESRDKFGEKFSKFDIIKIIPDFFDITKKFYSLLEKNRGTNDFCICGSGKKYKNCCRK